MLKNEQERTKTNGKASGHLYGERDYCENKIVVIELPYNQKSSINPYG
jgi:hypothetical protein